VSSRTWTPRAVASEAASLRHDLWRAVEAQHVVATMALVDTLDEQHALERILDAGKPAVPDDARRLHYLLFTPFRYAPPPGGSRFRGPNDAGVFYGADEVRTACAELGYWRWRHLLEVPALSAMPAKPQTVFRVKLATKAIDLREPPFARDREIWTHPDDYTGTQRFGVTARGAGVGAIRYESVRDPQHGGCCAVLAWDAFARPAPVEQQTWMLLVARERVVWQRTGALRADAHEFPSSGWSAPARAPHSSPTTARE
jgi:RES domain-containing protein